MKKEIKPKMKRFVSGTWICVGMGVTAWAKTAEKAYNLWAEGILTKFIPDDPVPISQISD